MTNNMGVAGGGGGAGYIRVNTTSGAATLSGTLSPAASTTCASPRHGRFDIDVLVLIP
jgi:hypothetical protein